MAIVKTLTKIVLSDSPHSEVKECTYAIIQGADGRKSLQIDTYGSAHRKMPNKKSQSIRFSPEAITQLRKILVEEF